MIEISIPGREPVKLLHLVLDYSGTISVDGKMLPGIEERLRRLKSDLTIHILTSDTHGKARDEINEAEYILRILEGPDHHLQKEEYVKRLGAATVVAIGNGNNDHKMLEAAGIGIAVCLEEGCSTEAIRAADLLVKSAADALDLLLYPNRLKATLRF